MDEIRRMRAGGTTPPPLRGTSPYTGEALAAGASPRPTMEAGAGESLHPFGAASFDKGGSQSGPVDGKQLEKWTNELRKYKTGKASLERRVVESENWWRLRNDIEERKNSRQNPFDFKSKSGWLHNLIVTKHADAMEAYPEAIMLPREPADRQEARMLTSIVPCILEQNKFEKTYSNVMWQKLKTGSGVYMVTWDAQKLNGLGDISIERVSLLNLFWEPEKEELQDSRYLFYVEEVDKEELAEEFPQLEGKLKGQTFIPTQFRKEDNASKDKTTVINVYYHKRIGGNQLLHYCKYVEGEILYSSENENPGKGFYAHGKYPFVIDTLFPVEGSPCGYGHIDQAKNSQEEIDLMKTAMLKNTMVGAIPRYFTPMDSSINEEDLLDLTKPLVKVASRVDDTQLRPIDYKHLDGNYLAMLQQTITELRETSGNTETAAGTSTSGVTAAAAIAAMQEASGKGSRDSSRGSYRAFSEVVELVIELMREFYNLPRQFRITGTNGSENFVTYSNQNLQPQPQPMMGGMDMGMRLPVFDIKIKAQKRDAYSRMSQNELMLEFYNAGFFDPNNTDMALTVMDAMDFEGKDSLMQKIANNGTMFQKLVQFQQLALTLAQQYQPQLVPQLAQSIMGQPVGGMAGAAAKTELPTEAAEESTHMQKARAQSQQASQPT